MKGTKLDLPGYNDDDDDSNKNLIINTDFHFFLHAHFLGTCFVLGTILGAEDTKISKKHTLHP